MPSLLLFERTVRDPDTGGLPGTPAAMLAPVAPVVSLDLDEREYGHALPRIDVDTVGRTVFLRGRVPTETVRQRAQVVALAVQPVRAVVNELRVGEDPE